MFDKVLSRLARVMGQSYQSYISIKFQPKSAMFKSYEGKHTLCELLPYSEKCYPRNQRLEHATDRRRPWLQRTFICTPVDVKGAHRCRGFYKTILRLFQERLAYI